MCGATETPRSRCSNAAPVTTSFQFGACTDKDCSRPPVGLSGPGHRKTLTTGLMAGSFGNFVDPRDIYIDRHPRVPVRYFRQMRKTRRHRSSCYGPREDEEEEVVSTPQVFTKSAYAPRHPFRLVHPPPITCAPLLSDRDPSAPIEGTGARSDAHAVCTRRAALRERADTSMFNAIMAPTRS